MSGGGQSVPKTLSTIRGEPKFFDVEVDSDPGNEQVLIDELVPVSKSWNLYSFKADSTTYGVFRIFEVTDPGDPGEAESLVGSGQTGPGTDGQFVWHPGRPIDEGKQIRVKYCQFAGLPIVPVRCHLGLAEQTTG